MNWTIITLSFPEQAVAVLNNLMSIIAIIVLAKVMGAKRFAKAVENNDAIPAKLVKELSEVLVTCNDFTLTIPGGLQAQAAMYSGPGTKQSTEGEQVA